MKNYLFFARFRTNAKNCIKRKKKWVCIYHFVHIRFPDIQEKTSFLPVCKNQATSDILHNWLYQPYIIFLTQLILETSVFLSNRANFPYQPYFTSFFRIYVCFFAALQKPVPLYVNVDCMVIIRLGKVGFRILECFINLYLVFLQRVKKIQFFADLLYLDPLF